MNARSIAQTGPTAKRPVGKVAGFLGIVVMLIATHRPIPTWPKSRQCSGGQVRDNVWEDGTKYKSNQGLFTCKEVAG